MNRVPHQLAPKPTVTDIRERAFKFAVRIVKLCRFLDIATPTSKNITLQLLKSGTSIGANLEEAQAAQSKADFVHKNSISLKEARESNYWIRLILETNRFDTTTKGRIKDLETESLELCKIIGKIIVSSKR